MTAAAETITRPDLRKVILGALEDAMCHATGNEVRDDDHR